MGRRRKRNLRNSDGGVQLLGNPRRAHDVPRDFKLVLQKFLKPQWRAARRLRAFIEQALALRPGDAYIVDSLGWVAFREGNLDEARRLLTQAYASRQDAEIAAHLGEVLWRQGDQEGAQKLWKEAQARDAANETLKETLQRFGTQP